MAPTSLTDLSAETLLQIAGVFCLHCQGQHHPQVLGIGTLEQRWLRHGQQSNHERWYSLNRHALFSLCLTSKLLRDIAQPVLYHEFMLGFANLPDPEGYSWEGRLLSWVRTITCRRDLAHRVKAISVPPGLTRGMDVKEGRRVLQQSATAFGIHDLAKVWRQRVADTCWRTQMFFWPPYFAPFLTDFLDGNGNLTESQQRKLTRAFAGPDCAVSRLVGAELFYHALALLPNLESFTVQVGPGIYDSASALQSLGVSQLPLKHYHGDVLLKPVLEISVGLESLTLNGNTISPQNLPSFPNLKALHLTATRLGAVDLRAILDHCTTRLHTFVYEAREEAPLFTCVVDFGSNTAPSLLPSDLAGCFEKHRNTLKLLHLDMRLQCCAPGPSIHQMLNRLEFTPPDIRLNLGQFASLETLFLSSNLVYQRDPYINHAQGLLECLPPAITSLHLVQDKAVPMADVETGLIYLAQERKRLPHLQHIFWDAEHKFSDDAVENIFASHDVEFGYESWPLSTESVRSAREPKGEQEPFWTMIDSEDDDL